MTKIPFNSDCAWPDQQLRFRNQRRSILRGVNITESNGALLSSFGTGEYGRDRASDCHRRNGRIRHLRLVARPIPPFQVTFSIIVNFYFPSTIDLI